MKYIRIIVAIGIAVLMIIPCTTILIGANAEIIEPKKTPIENAIHPPREQNEVIEESKSKENQNAIEIGSAYQSLNKHRIKEPKINTDVSVSLYREIREDTTYVAEEAETYTDVNVLMEVMDSDEEHSIKIWTKDDAIMLSKTVWGEARGCSTLQKAGVVWCILNRVDSDRFENTIAGVITAPSQFFGYSANNPIDEEITGLVIDILTRWSVEDSVVGGIGRVLPKEYLYFSGDGTRNWYTTSYGGGNYWDWSLENPYE